jgi:hypothetical protein
MVVCYYWNHDAVRIWAYYWWPGRYVIVLRIGLGVGCGIEYELMSGSDVHWMDCSFFLHNVRCAGHGRNCISYPNSRRTLLLGRHSRTTQALRIRSMDNRLVQSLPLPNQPSLTRLTNRFNFLGQVAVTTGISFGLAGLISTTATVKSSYEPTAAKTIGIYAAVLISHGIINTFGVHILRYLNNSSILLHSVGVTSLAIAVLAKAPTHQSAKFVFASFYDGTGVAPDPGWSVRASPAYLACCGALMSQYTLTGFDASAHLSEETRKASWSAPIGVISSVGFSSLFGLFVLLSFLFSIQDFDGTVSSSVGQPVLQIFIDVFGDDGAVVLMCLVMICVWHCGLFSMTSNSRMMFAFARDGGIVRSPFPSVARVALPPRESTQANVKPTAAFLPQSRRPLPLSHPHRLARSNTLLLPSAPLAGQFRRLRSSYLHRHNRTVYLLRHPYLNWTYLSQDV